jgi:hypothetical protein
MKTFLALILGIWTSVWFAQRDSVLKYREGKDSISFFLVAIR